MEACATCAQSSLPEQGEEEIREELANLGLPGKPPLKWMCL